MACAAWLYRPDGVENPPIVVLAHGFAAFRELRLDAYAARFAQAGYAALVFDYRFWGASGGEPRRVLDIAAQQADWRPPSPTPAASTASTPPGWWAGVPPSAAVTSWTWPPTTTTLAAAIVQVPHVTGPASAFAQSPTLVARLVVGGGCATRWGTGWAARPIG